MNAAEIAAALGGTPSGDGWKIPCPAHPDEHPSAWVADGDNGSLRAKCHAGCSYATFLRALQERGLIDGNGLPRKAASRAAALPAPRKAAVTADPSGALGKPASKAPPPWERPIERTYAYRGFEKVRFADGLEPRFAIRRVDSDGKTRWNRQGITPHLYGDEALPDAIREGRTVLLCEGERDCETARGLGFIATTAPDGGGNWQPEYSTALAGAHVAIVPDVDRPGSRYAQAKARALFGVARSVRIVELAGLTGEPDSKDLSNWIALGLGADALKSAVRAAPVLTEAPPVTSHVTAPGEAVEADVRGDDLILDPHDPMPTARAYLAAQYMEGETPLLRHHSGLFYSFDGRRYRGAADDELRAGLWPFLESARAIRRTRQGDVTAPFKPTAARVSDVLDALRAVVHLAPEIEAPCWLPGFTGLNPAELIVCRNGLLDLNTGELHMHTPGFWSHHALDFDFDPGAGAEPPAWLRFLDDLWGLDEHGAGADPQAVEILQEWFGYLLTPRTELEKILLIVGPKRAGKGTIARVLVGLLGPDAVAAPTLAALSTNFGLAPLIRRRLAIIADARLGGRADQHAIAERLLAISGEDSQTIDRKHLDAWTGRLAVRFVILTNEAPRIADTSGALASRFIVLPLTRSFLGREDPGLTDELLAERPAILNWARVGWERLKARGRFLQPDSALELVREIEDLGSPVAAFARDRCRVEPGATAPVASVFAAWRSWCEQSGRREPGTVQTFGRDLRAACPGVRIAYPRLDDGQRARMYEGVRLREHWEKD